MTASIMIYVAALTALHMLLCVWAASALALFGANIMYRGRFMVAHAHRLRTICRWSLAICIVSFVAMVVIGVAVKPLHRSYGKQWSFGLVAAPAESGDRTGSGP
jgi:hypothetical protein